MTTHTDADGARIGGFKLLKSVSTQGTEKKPGKITVTLEAPKEEISTGPYTLGDLLAAFNAHQEGSQSVVLRALMPTNVVPDTSRIESEDE
jgi:hypothetical protein